VSDSVRPVLRVAGTTFLTLALGCALVLGLAACGGGATDTTAGVALTEVDGTPVTADGAPVTAEGTATSEAVGPIDQALVGKWYLESTAETLEFTADGRMVVTSDVEEGTVEYTYTADGQTAVIIDGMDRFTRTYSIDGKALTMTDSEAGESVTYARVE
jgi:hypothetical protein